MAFTQLTIRGVCALLAGAVALASLEANEPTKTESIAPTATEVPTPAAKPASDPATATPQNVAGERAAQKSVEQLVESARKSVVVIHITGRDGKQEGLGTGFVVGSDGLIATNQHVIGEARPISVQTYDGKQHPVTFVHASHRASDLALIRIEATGLPALELGDADALKQGQPVVALGNPFGLKHSVVSGVVSGIREIGGRSMIQVAIPIEVGNSGGPLLDMLGRVQGIVTMKSMRTANLGFAVPVNALRPLLEKPNPIRMERWLTIGALDPKEWIPLFGARWTQRSGHILVDGAGKGMGGRSLCLSELPVPMTAYEIAVKVRLDDERGAAGLVFRSDGNDKHYGFYPSNGKLRLSRFDGPDVYSWNVLFEKSSPHYHPEEWNLLKVRVEDKKIRCFVNDQLVIETESADSAAGKFGLAKFRDTKAEFKGFQVGPEIASSQTDAALLERVHKVIEGLPEVGDLPADSIERLAADAPSSLRILHERAKRLDQQAAQLRALAAGTHQKRVQSELLKTLSGREEEINLVRGALLVAQLDNDELDVDAYLKQFDKMAAELATRLPPQADEKTKLATLDKYLFEENGFHGSHGDYNNRSNSYLNEVIDDREGIPITLSVLYLELSRRIGLNVVGIGLPGHFVVAHLPVAGERQLIDVFDGGTRLSRQDADRLVRGFIEGPLQEEHLAPVTKQVIIDRVLRVLFSRARDEKDLPAMLRYTDAILAISPESATDHWFRALLHYELGQYAQAAVEVEWLLERQPANVKLEDVRELGRVLDRLKR